MPVSTIAVIRDAINQTKEFTEYTFNVCLNYGSRSEIVRAARMFAEDVVNKKVEISSLNEENFKDYLYTSGLPDVDLLIRTSGEERISNYLLYQMSYAEFIFDKTYWPDFDVKRLYEDLEIYNSRNRRFGEIKHE